MSTGLFSTSTAGGIGARAHQRKLRQSYRARRNQHTAELLFAFAEPLSEGERPEDIAENMGFTRIYGRVLLKKLRERMGEQAK